MTYFEFLVVRYEIPGVFLNQQAFDLDGTRLPMPMMPSDVPGLNLYFVVTMEPVEGKPQTINCGLEIQVSSGGKYLRIKSIHPGLCQHQRHPE